MQPRVFRLVEEVFPDPSRSYVSGMQDMQGGKVGKKISPSPIIKNTSTQLSFGLVAMGHKGLKLCVGAFSFMLARACKLVTEHL